MKSGIHINGKELKFIKFPLEEIGAARFCKSFKLNLEDIRFVAISPRLIIDDEGLFILIVDSTGKIYPMPQQVLGSVGIKEFEKYFRLKPLREEWGKFDYNDHYGKQDKIVYPPEHYWKDLFASDWKLKVRQLYSWANPKSFFGNIEAKNGG